MTVDEKDEKIVRLLESVHEVSAVFDDGESIRILISDPYSQTPKILSILLKEGYHVTEMRVREPTLEDVFIQAVKKKENLK